MASPARRNNSSWKIGDCENDGGWGNLKFLVFNIYSFSQWIYLNLFLVGNLNKGLFTFYKIWINYKYFNFFPFTCIWVDTSCTHVYLVLYIYVFVILSFMLLNSFLFCSFIIFSMRCWRDVDLVLTSQMLHQHYRWKINKITKKLKLNCDNIKKKLSNHIRPWAIVKGNIFIHTSEKLKYFLNIIFCGEGP